MVKILLWSMLGLVAIAARAMIYGSIHWQSATATMHARRMS